MGAAVEVPLQFVDDLLDSLDAVVDVFVEGVVVVEVDTGQRSVHGRKELGGRGLVTGCGAQLQRAHRLMAVRRHLEHQRLQRIMIHRAQKPLDVRRHRILQAVGPDHHLHPLIIADRFARGGRGRRTDPQGRRGPRARTPSKRPR